VKGFVDRRYNRDAYDAKLAVDGFAESLRSDVELDAIRRDLVEVAAATVQPMHASVWLSSPDDEESPEIAAAVD
jgi:hypothetical protein